MEPHEYIAREYLDSILHYPNRNLSGLLKPFERLIRTAGLSVGDHLITPRIGYTHHGIYAGSGQVIHYSGLSDGLRSGPIMEVSLDEFENGRGYRVKQDVHRAFDGLQSVERARTRMQEQNYNLIFNNCEHFVTWCIHGKGSSSQVNGASKIAAQSLVKRVPFVNAGVGFLELGNLTKSYLKGDITKEHYYDKTSESIVTSTSIAYYSVLGQASIPIPIVGALVGASVGYMVSSMLNQSGLVSLGETPGVKHARKRRIEIESLCERLIPEIKRAKDELNSCLERHFTERKKVFDEQFSKMDMAMSNWDSDMFSEALKTIGSQFEKEFELLNFEEFSSLMESDDAFYL